MADHFNNFKELAETMIEGVDYQIEYKHRKRSNFLILAPHGGKIESTTSKLTKMIAGEDHSYYLFEGIRRQHNTKLHITSHNFDEPQALWLATMIPTVLGIHGRCNASDEQSIYLGGRDNKLLEVISSSLLSNGFKNSIRGHKFPALRKMNICNRGMSGKGVQMEFPEALRIHLSKTENADLLTRCISSIRASLTE